MLSYHDKVKRLQKFGVLFHKAPGLYNESSTLICSQTGWTFFRGNVAFLEKILESYNIPVVNVYEGPVWENPLPNWPQVSFEEANRLRNEYNEKWL